MSFNKWYETTLGEVCEFQKGYAFKSKDYQDKGRKIVKVSDLNNYSVNLERCICIAENKAEDYLRYSLKKDDVIITTVGSWPSNPNSVVGKVVKVQKDAAGALLNQNAVRVRAKDKAIQKFVFYTLKNKLFFDYIVGTAQGAANQASITQNDIKNFVFQLPELIEQKGIVDVLSCLDEKIEINNSINKKIEEMALTIYKNWFIDFEPFQDGEFEESDLGKIPKGWNVGKLGNSIITKLIKPGINSFERKKVYLATADVENTSIINNSTKVTMQDRPTRANMQPKINTVWFAKMKDSRKLLYVDTFSKELIDNYIFSTGFAGITCLQNSLYYIWCFLLSDNFESIKNSLCNGTTMQAINNDNINKINLIIPNENVLMDFHKIVLPLFNQFYNNSQQNIMLEAIRDSILPKLMSGEIRVPVEEVQ